MLPRALIVLLLVLNVGVATWWATRQPPPPSMPTPPPGAARLQLLGEAPRHAQPAPATTPPAIAPVPAATSEAVAPARCFSFGPFADAAATATARARLQPLVVRIATRDQPATTTRGWRVQMPPLASPEAAQAMAQRIAAAGFSDFLVVHDGAEANAIALGRYSGEDSARRRAAALVAAGFDARAEPLGDAQAATWLDVVAAAGFNAAAAQATTAAPQRRPLDCARLK